MFDFAHFKSDPDEYGDWDELSVGLTTDKGGAKIISFTTKGSDNLIPLNATQARELRDFLTRCIERMEP